MHLNLNKQSVSQHSHVGKPNKLKYTFTQHLAACALFHVLHVPRGPRAHESFSCRLSTSEFEFNTLLC